MPISAATTIARIRTLIAEVTDMERVFAASESDENAIPMSINEFPAALVYPGATDQYILHTGQHRHTYEVIIQVLEAGADVGERAAAVLPFVDRILEKLVGNVTLGGRVNSCLITGNSGFSKLEYAGGEYLGYEITLTISEQATASPAAGS